MRIFSRDTITDFVRRGDLAGVRRRLEKGDNVNERRSFNNTPLIEAARYNVVDILELLIAHGADLELTNSNDLTALHAAIDEKRSTTAIVLAQHGASANHVGLFGRTPLQCAVMRDLLDVTAVLLAYGADPTVKSDSGKTALAYVRAGRNFDEFEKLLTAYTSVQAAIGAMNADAMAVCLREMLTGDRTANVTSIDAAIGLKHTEAVTILLQMSLASSTLEEMVETYKIVEQRVRQTEEDWQWQQELGRFGLDFGRGVLTLLMNSGDIELLKQLVADATESNWIQNLRLSNGWTPLHLAASQTNFALVQYLVVECGCDPLLLSPSGRTAFDCAVELDRDSRVARLLREHVKQRAFWERATLILSALDVSVTRLRPLLSLMTSVYDLQIIFGLVFRTLSPVEMHAILSEAFDEVIRAKLAVDDQATAFLQLALRVCRRANVITEVEQLKWDLKATKVRGARGVWDGDIKRSLLERACTFRKTAKNSALLQKQYNLLREGLYRQSSQGKISPHTRQRNLSLLFVALVLCGCSGYKDDFGAVCNPAKFLAMISADDVENFLAGIINAFSCKVDFEAVLVHSAIDPMELVLVLRDVAKLELPESVKTKSYPWKPPDRIIIST